MACFTACFPASNHKKLIKSTNNDVIPSPSTKQCLRSLLEIDYESEVMSMKSSQIEDNKDEGGGGGEPEISTESSFFSLPLSHLTRPRGCKNCGEEDEEDESLFSLSVDSIRRQKSSSANQNGRRDSDQSVQSEPNQTENPGPPREEKKITQSPLLQELQEKENLQKLENSPRRRRRRGRKCNKGFGKRPILGALNWNLISRN